ncbi:hypothetical protein CJZ71_15840 [Bacillus subtilis]|uniref:hypothetical protein n=1 Tax=Bacillus subtilis TaxID=1423 RepID=UPI0008529EA2|nr:hypothetical protein [Bacillus subtilis]AOS66813.1 hypothetical protein A4A60_03645 [Bacillus subtilis]ARW30313.1 hypothetical protein S101441_00743 [Bacillus subtilis subsp. subtilis]ASV03483.1 hypothetical protein CJZ71_15840 [Bacillus subtilis]AYK55914.1 hypothetical protein D9C10_01170 [Bacillus subtilis subsp. subtilis]AYK69559.1 hypothetical protein D9C09_07260 [Bacillus subtilis subsp. subtilis]
MSGDNLILFERTDNTEKFIEQAVKEIADHFSNKRSYLKLFVRLIRNSHMWKIENIESELQNVESIFQRFIDGGSELVTILRKAFTSCKKTKHLKKLRGALAEGLLISMYGGSNILDSPSYGWGARVKLNTRETTLDIVYDCPFHTDKTKTKCRRRSTVDLGYWDGNNGKFFECKVRPENITCSEFKYMNTLHRELSERKINHEIFFVSTDTKDSIEMTLKKEQNYSNIFKVISLQGTIA